MREITNFFITLIVLTICTLLLDLCYAKLNGVKLKLTKKNFFIIIITSMCTILNNTYLDFRIKPFLAIFIVCLHYKLIFKDNWKKIIVSYFLIYLLLVLVEIIFTNILAITGILNSNSIASTLTFSNLLLSLVVQILEYCLFLLPITKYFLKKIHKIILNHINLLNIVLIMLVITAILGMLNIELFAEKDSMKLLIILFLLFLLLTILIFKLKFSEEALKINNKQLIDYNDKYGKFLDEYKIYKHNIKNKLFAMKSYGNKRINALIDDLLEEETDFSIKNNNLYNVPNGIKGIVAEKLYNANFNILIDNKIKNDPFKKLSPKAFNSISESIGIALDNAIEASYETKNPVITFELKENKENIFVRIGNNFCNAIDIEKLGTKYYSTKNRGSGLGLFSIMRNYLVKEKINIINDFYYIELQIKKAR